MKGALNQGFENQEQPRLSNMSQGYQVKFNGLVEMFRINRQLTPRQLLNIGAFVDEGSEVRERPAKLELALELIRANPGAHDL